MSSDDPLALTKGRHKGGASGENLQALPKGKGQGRAVTTPRLFPIGKARGGQTVTTPCLFLTNKAKHAIISCMLLGRGSNIIDASSAETAFWAAAPVGADDLWYHTGQS